MKISVIVPVFNEKNTINEIIRRIKAVNIPKEIIIVDDFSTDGTREYLKNLKDPLVRTFFHEKNLGKGSALRTGIRHIAGDIAIIQDADLEYDPQDYYNLVKPIMQGEYKVVYGTRFPKGRPHPSLFSSFYLANRILTLMANTLYRAQITDEPTCYKVFDAKLLKSINLKSTRFEFCPEVTAKIKKRGYKICEVPINYSPRTVEQGKKIKWKDGVEAAWTLIKYKFKD